MTSILLFSFLIAGSCAKPLIESSQGSINKIDLEPRTEIEIVGQDVDVSTIKDGIIESTSTTSKPGLLTWFLAPFAQNFQINAETLQHRLTQLKETLNSLGLVAARDSVKGKQLASANNLLQLVGADNAGFYTNRIEPAGFFGGNGWLANKGGILGGPGAILSTGSILTDYPSAYRRK